MVTVLYWVMVVSLGLMCWLAYEYRVHGKSKTKVMAVAVSFLALACAVTTMLINFWGPTFQYKNYQRKEAKFQYVSHKILGEEISKKHAGAKLLIVEYEEYSGPTEATETIDPDLDINGSAERGLKEGLGDSVEIIHRQPVRIEDEYYFDMEQGRARPTAPAYSAKLLNALIKKYKECDVILLKPGLPINHEKELELWRIEDPKNRPALVIKGLPGSPMKKAIERGYVSIILAEVPRNFDLDEPLPEDAKAIFDSRYVLITKETYDSLLTSYPQLFNNN